VAFAAAGRDGSDRGCSTSFRWEFERHRCNRQRTGVQ